MSHSYCRGDDIPEREYFRATDEEADLRKELALDAGPEQAEEQEDEPEQA